MSAYAFKPIDDYDPKDKLMFPKTTILPVEMTNLQKTEGDSMMTHLEASGSGVNEIDGRMMNFKKDSTLNIKNIGGRSARISFGDKNPFGVKGAKTILSGYIKYIMGFSSLPDLSVDEISFMRDLPQSLERRPIFQNTSKVSLSYHKRGNNSTQAQRELGVNYRSLYEVHKEKALLHEQLAPDRINWFSQKEQSRLVLNGIQTDDGMTHEEIVKRGSPNDMHDLLVALTKGYWWKDVMNPRDITSSWENQTAIMYGLNEYEGDVSG